MEALIGDSHLSTPLVTVITRMLMAVLFGGLIGWEREITSRAAGLRTHMLISLAAATFAVLGRELMNFGNAENTESNPLELISAVTSGVAFLAAGSIVISGGNVRGVTTGASMWLCGAIGLCCGIGDVVLGGLATVMALAVLWLIRLLVRPMADKMKDDADQPGDDASLTGDD